MGVLFSKPLTERWEMKRSSGPTSLSQLLILWVGKLRPIKGEGLAQGPYPESAWVSSVFREVVFAHRQGSYLNFSTVTRHHSLLLPAPTVRYGTCPIETSGQVLPGAWSGILRSCPSVPSLCSAEQVSSSGCFLDPISELPADKRLLFGHPGFHGQVAGTLGPAHSHRGRCLGSGAGWAQGHCLPWDVCFQKETTLIKAPSNGQVLTNWHHLTEGTFEELKHGFFMLQTSRRRTEGAQGVLCPPV